MATDLKRRGGQFIQGTDSRPSEKEPENKIPPEEILRRNASSASRRWLVNSPPPVLQSGEEKRDVTFKAILNFGRPPGVNTLLLSHAPPEIRNQLAGGLAFASPSFPNPSLGGPPFPSRQSEDTKTTTPPSAQQKSPGPFPWTRRKAEHEKSETWNRFRRRSALVLYQWRPRTREMDLRERSNSENPAASFLKFSILIPCTTFSAWIRDASLGANGASAAR